MNTILLVSILAISPEMNELAWCQLLAPKYNAKTEVVLWDLSRVDLLSPDEAIEVDWAHKWAEAIGQTSYYATVTRRQPAILLLREPNDEKHIYRAQTVCTKLNIHLYLEPTQ